MGVNAMLTGDSVHESKKNHYSFDYKGIRIDPYRLFRIYNIYDPEQQHAIKKLLRAGKSVKTLEQDINETIVTLERWKEILKEDELADNDIPTNKPMERTSAKYNL